MQDGIEQQQENNTMQRIVHAILIGCMLSVLVACADMSTNQGQGTALGTGVGAGVGAILGQAIGRNTEGTLVGAGIGAALGGAAGNRIGWYMDRQEQELRAAVAASEAASIRRSQDVLIATLRGETYFDHNSALLKSGGYNEISRVAAVLQRYPQTRIRVAGHTDTSGPESYNQQLSIQRAEAVRDAMIQQGVDPGRIVPVGFGESQPISSDFAMNRRVEITIIPVEQANATFSSRTGQVSAR